MKIFYLTIFFLTGILLLKSSALLAQKMLVNKYETVIRTTNGTVKGFLEEVTDSTASIINKNGEAIIPYQMINKIIIKRFKKAYITSENARMASLKQPPSEQINNDHSTIVMTTAAVLSQTASAIAYNTNKENTYYAAQAASFALPILGFLFKDSFSNIDKFKIYRKLEKYQSIKNELQTYSIRYQIQ